MRTLLSVIVLIQLSNILYQGAGHFTAMVWAGSTGVGCAKASGSGRRTKVGIFVIVHIYFELSMILIDFLLLIV